VSDLTGIEAWVPKFEKWRAESVPLMMKGKAKEAFSVYPWFQGADKPFARLEKPASESRFALITTGGYSIEGEQEKFGGPSFDDTAPRVNTIPLDVDTAKLRIDHPGYDHRFAEEDHNVNLPLDRLQELVANGEIGSVSPDTHVVMGLIPNIVPLLRETIPALVAKLKADSVDGALLVPS
jgi:D-proline reductase (dithiol) PrdB